MLDKELFSKLKQFFESKNQFLLVYLFGSRVRGKTGAISDYDFAVLPAGSISSDDYYQLIHELVLFFKGARVDLVFLKEVPIELRYNVIATGKLIYSKDKFYQVEFEANTLSQYFDYLPILYQQRKDILKGENYERGIQRYREAFRKAETLFNEIRGIER